jgi:hypothetical protein
VFELGLTAWTAKEVIHALIFDHNMGFAALKTLATYRVFE